MTQLKNSQAPSQLQTHSQFFFSAVLGIGVVLSSGSAVAQSKLDVAPEYFSWEELDDDGSQLLEETGWRIGLEYSYKTKVDRGWLPAAKIKLYYGSVDYDGQLQNGTPYKTTTEYYGGLLEFGFGYRFELGSRQCLDVMGGLGMDFWLRRLDPDGDHGYDEFWLPFYLKVGADLCPTDGAGWIASLGLKFPIYTFETVDLGVGTVDLNPNGKPTFYAEAGYRFTKSLSLTGFYDAYWFDRSDVERGFYQPDSRSYQIGAKLGWAF